MAGEVDSQRELILIHLKSGRALTPMDALSIYGCFRLAARINDLRDAGHAIATEIVKGGGKRWASYTLLGQRELAFDYPTTTQPLHTEVSPMAPAPVVTRLGDMQ